MPHRLLPLFALILAAAISAAEPRPRIVNSENVPESSLPEVAEFYLGQATGVLIAPNAILTAAHNVTYLALEAEGEFYGGEVEFSFLDVPYRAARVHVHPSYKGFVGVEEGQFDLAIVILEKNVTGVTPAPILRQPPELGTEMIFAGYGYYTIEGDDEGPPAGQVTAATITADRITPTFIFNTVGKSKPFGVPGDSGGPVFVEVNGVRHVAAIHSGGVGKSETSQKLGINPRVDAVADWIDGLIGTSAAPGTGSITFTRGPGFTDTPAAMGELLTFYCYASEHNLKWSWHFGDGTPLDTTGPFPTHTYSAPGTYMVTVTATRPADGAVQTSTFPVLVLNATRYLAFTTKKSFSFSFSAPEKTKMVVPLLCERFAFPELLTGEIQLYLNGQLFDTLTFNGKTGAGEFSSVKLSKLQLTCTLTGAKVAAALQDAGNLETAFTVAVPFHVVAIGTETERGFVRYGSDVIFKVKASPGKGATGTRPR